MNEQKNVKLTFVLDRQKLKTFERPYELFGTVGNKVLGRPVVVKVNKLTHRTKDRRS